VRPIRTAREDLRTTGASRTLHRVQRYVSRDLSHFVGRALANDDARYELLVEILRSGALLPRAGADPEKLGYAVHVDARESLSSGLQVVPEAVCFCDIPVADLQLHTAKYGAFGLAFPKERLVSVGASPVFYVAANSIVGPDIPDMGEPPLRLEVFDMAVEAYHELMRRLAEEEHKEFVGAIQENMTRVDRSNALAAEIREHIAASREVPEALLEELRELEAAYEEARRKSLTEFEELQDLQRRGKSPAIRFYQARPGALASVVASFITTHVLAFVKIFDDALADDDPDNFYMEREWRVLGSVRFQLDDVARVFLPRSYARRIRDDLPEYVGQVDFLEGP
jgi:hypothetical protein